MISWFISPWEAARLSLEAQRIMAFHFFRFAFGQEQPRQTDGVTASVARKVDQSNVASMELTRPAGAMANVRPKTVPVRNATEAIGKPVGTRKVKAKRSKRKNKTHRK
jgi:hypothetical protein